MKRQKYTDDQIKYSREAANVLSTALIFARTVKKQKNLLNQIVNINKIISEINFYHIRIQELRAEENEAVAQYIKAAKLYMGGAKKALEAAKSINFALGKAIEVWGTIRNTSIEHLVFLQLTII